MSTSKTWVAYPVTRENPKDFHEVHQHEIFDRPIANRQAQVIVSKNHSLTKGFVSKVMSVKSLIPGGASYWKYNISEEIIDNEPYKRRASVSKKSRTSEDRSQTFETHIDVLFGIDVYVLLLPGSIVVELSEDGISKIGVVRSFPVDMQQIPVTHLVSLNVDDSFSSDEAFFTRNITYQVLYINIFTFYALNFVNKNLQFS
jgi:hypothetical protein